MSHGLHAETEWKILGGTFWKGCQEQHPQEKSVFVKYIKIHITKKYCDDQNFMELFIYIARIMKLTPYNLMEMTN